MKIIKIKSLLSMLLVGVALVACNSGGGGNSGTSDVQSDSGTTQIGSDIMTYSFTATGCSTIVSGGSCSVALTYFTNNVSSVYIGSLFLQTETSPGQLTSGFSSTIGSCSAVSMSSQSCNFTITATESANVNLVQSAILLSGITEAAGYTFAAFQIGH